MAGPSLPGPDPGSRPSTFSFLLESEGPKSPGFSLRAAHFNKASSAGHQILSPVGQAVFDLGLHLTVDDPPNDPIALHLTKLLN